MEITAESAKRFMLLLKKFQIVNAEIVHMPSGTKREGVEIWE